MGMAQNMGIFKKLEVHSLTISGTPNPHLRVQNISLTVNHGLKEVPDFVLLYPKQRIIPASENTDMRILQFAYWFGIGSKRITNELPYEQNMNGFIRLYTNTSNSKYEQGGFGRDGDIINSLTADTITIGGTSAPANVGLVNGEYWVLIGKIADKYSQGEQVVFVDE